MRVRTGVLCDPNALDDRARDDCHSMQDFFELRAALRRPCSGKRIK